ncbi:MAG: type I methionyl aminopeptidase [Paenibacillus macerans]|uniref:Methionine aminopeptidase n=2 Tax=Paenibacillus macerans TaxID=44252 RepID=A0A6N8F6Q6_PAEMA|nr:type I methionyl aminopeptidase [Paenibacillus macerans]MBS5909037.1 type I methionyl aminopeptidase [Paenibacillus macerans]MCY7559480.1 type I methionyl aminopeptidase [Paenibacillus macerans]MDU7473887.1 type I methionyl aminopeptidase [Paenibacillus macerans]MEC0137385.1 type I methionyl aminopeptidase [Paenibacillus macerans]MEC0150623.1 type I methionyl aminopeptidase [Paenibacillus macerans]
MKIQLKTKEEILRMREAGRILAECHQGIARLIGPGITTLEIDRFVESFLAERGATPEQKGYRGFPFATCASVNDVVCHGFPNDRKLQAGDIVTIDIVVNKNGWLADSAWSYRVGKVGPDAEKLLQTTEKALDAGIAQAYPGSKIGDIGYAVQRVATAANVGIVRALIGHGIGRSMHEPPDVPNFGRPKSGVTLRPGMVITIEPIFTGGDTGAVLWEDDGWTIRSADGSLGAHYEHTLAITEDGPLVLTK